MIEVFEKRKTTDQFFQHLMDWIINCMFVHLKKFFCQRRTLCEESKEVTLGSQTTSYEPAYKLQSGVYIHSDTWFQNQHTHLRFVQRIK